MIEKTFLQFTRKMRLEKADVNVLKNNDFIKKRKISKQKQKTKRLREKTSKANCQKVPEEKKKLSILQYRMFR